MEEKKVLLSVKDLVVKFRVRGRILTAIRGISLELYHLRRPFTRGGASVKKLSLARKPSAIFPPPDVFFSRFRTF